MNNSCACCGAPYSLGDTGMCFDCLADFLDSHYLKEEEDAEGDCNDSDM